MACHTEDIMKVISTESALRMKICAPRCAQPVGVRMTDVL